MTRMSALRVIKGPAAVAYGPQTVGGAVDFISRPIPAKTSAELDVGYGQYGYTKADGWFGSSNEQIGFLVSGTRLHDEGFKQLPSGADTGSQ
jgi:Fe(3+) dicitrate transport protein